MGHNNRPVQALNDRPSQVRYRRRACGSPAQATTKSQTREATARRFTGDTATFDGPHVWGDLSPEYSTCATGVEQSPVNIQKALTTEAKDKSVFTNYGDTLVADNQQRPHHPGQLRRGQRRLPGTAQQYDLLQFHFHTPSENMVNNSAFPHEDAPGAHERPGGLGVIGVLFEE